MDWFERLTGFAESDYDTTQSRLAVDGEFLLSRMNGQRYRIGTLELASLASLRTRLAQTPPTAGRPQVAAVTGDVKQLHLEPTFHGALFQVASQFNLLEMTSPNVRPEDGVSRYDQDHTQGPACAIAAGAATIYRNYLAPVDGRPGQHGSRQIDTLTDLGAALAAGTGLPLEALWTMRNGYALCTRTGLDAIGRFIRSRSTEAVDSLRGLLRIGLHRNVQVTLAGGPASPVVSQAFCSALPVAYCNLPDADWQPFAQLVLEAAYEATLLAGLLHSPPDRGGIVLLTMLGGGAFGNDTEWIEAAIRNSLNRVAGFELDVRIVCFGSVPGWVTRL